MYPGIKGNPYLLNLELFKRLLDVENRPGPGSLLRALLLATLRWYFVSFSRRIIPTPLQVSRLVIRNVSGASIDYGHRLVLPSSTSVFRILLNHRTGALHVQPASDLTHPIDYSPDSHIPVTAPEARLEVTRVESIELVNSSLTLFGYPGSLRRLTMHASSVHVLARSDELLLSLSVGSTAVFSGTAHCNRLTVEMADENTENAVYGATYVHSFNSIGPGIPTCRSLAVKLARENAAPRRSLSAPVPGLDIYWQRLAATPTGITTNNANWTSAPICTATQQQHQHAHPTGAPPADEQPACCSLCQIAEATIGFTNCPHKTLCSGCVEGALVNRLIDCRRCPFCRHVGPPVLPQQRAVHC